MKLIAVSILILLLLTQTFGKWVIIAGFEANRDYISRNLCINKEKPKLQCKGKCQLMKKLAEEENQDQGTKNPPKLKMDESYFSFQLPVFNCNSITPVKQVFSGPGEKPCSIPLASVFHPPA